MGLDLITIFDGPRLLTQHPIQKKQIVATIALPF
jgi:hypothetical protein